MAAFFTITMAQAMEILVHVLKTWEQKKEFCICDICDFYYFVFSIFGDFGNDVIGDDQVQDERASILKERGMRQHPYQFQPQHCMYASL